ncbi:MAG: glycerophosphodiester phosphodiesterase family protein [Methanosarcinaceae archaeon]
MLIRIIMLVPIIICFMYTGLKAISTKVIAHRGASSVAPENTLVSFIKAIEFGADYIELDVHSSQDDSLMVIHDATVNRTTNGTGIVQNMTYTELRQLDAGSWFSNEFAREKIPTLSEALFLAYKNNIKVCIELKMNNITENVINLIEKMNMEDEVIIFCFDFTLISQSKLLNPSILSLYLQNTITTTHIDNVVGISADVVGSGGGTTQSIIDYAHQKGIEYWKWTVNSIDEMNSLLTMSVDGIITDYPQLLIALLDTTPPTDVVMAEHFVEITTINLRWNPAEDTESGIASYILYSGLNPDSLNFLDTVYDTFYQHTTEMEETTFYFNSKAVNGRGILSLNFSNLVTATTKKDTLPPEVVFVKSQGSPQSILLQFNERVETESAEDISNYIINNQIEVFFVRLCLDSTTIILSTSNLEVGTDYILSLSDIKDRAKNPNKILPGTSIPFTHIDFLPGIVSNWSLNEGKGNTAIDFTGNNNHGTLHSATWIIGQEGNALYFNGITDYVQIPNSNTLNIDNDAVSISLWVKLEQLPSGLPGNFGPIYDSDQDSYIIYEDRGNNELRFKVTTQNGLAQRPGIRSFYLNTHNWFHIAGVYDGNSASIYLNNELKDKHNNISGNVKLGQIARLGENGDYYFKGKIDDIRIYNRALAKEEITFLYTGWKYPTVIDHNEKTGKFNASLFTFPNPFNSSTTVRFILTKPSLVNLEVYNLLGQKIAILINKERLTIGEYERNWNSKNISCGIYFIYLEASEFKHIMKCILLK